MYAPAKENVMKRRDFLKCQLAGAALLAAGGLPQQAHAQGASTPGPEVIVSKGAPAAATRAAVQALGGIKAFIKAGDKVVIKPNMSFPHPVEQGTNTHPEVVATLVALCKEAGAARIVVLDHPFNNVERCLEQSGIAAACNLLDPAGKGMVYGLKDQTHFQEASIAGALSMPSAEVMKEVLAADKIISAPTAKHHGSAGVSLSMKGMMGLIYNRSVMHAKYDLDEAIVDLASLLKPAFAVVDCNYVLQTNGPSGPGQVLKADTVIASRDMVAADAHTVASFEWYGRRFEPRQIKHIRRAAERGLGRMDNLTIRQISA